MRYYSAVKEVVLDDKNLAVFYESNKSPVELLENEYLLIKDVNGKCVDKYKFKNNKLNKFVSVKHRKMKLLKPLDEIQDCAYDCLFDDDVKIVSLIGQSGTGKTKTSISVGLRLLKMQKYDKILILRNPEFQGKEIGFFPGEKYDKLVDGGFASSIIDNLDGDRYEFEDLTSKGRIELDIVSAIKGRNFENTYVIVDEAQDLLPINVMGIGTRINEDSCKIVFCADFQQCASNKYFTNSGLENLIQKAYGQDWFSCIELKTNGRGKIVSWFNQHYLVD